MLLDEMIPIGMVTKGSFKYEDIRKMQYAKYNRFYDNVYKIFKKLYTEEGKK